MKKFVSLALCLAMIMAWIPGGAAGAANGAPFAGGSGTENDPYLISTADQLHRAYKYPEAHFLQINDIDLAGRSITSLSLDAGGVYDGGGHRIIGYYSTSYGSPLFSRNYGTIRNLGLVDVSLRSQYRTTYGKEAEDTLGALVDTNGGLIQSCYLEDVYVSISVDMDSEYSVGVFSRAYAGGFAAKNTGTIRDCYIIGGDFYAYSSASAEGPVTEAVSYAYAGGIAGYNSNQGSVERCYIKDVSTYASGRYTYKSVICGSNNGSISGCYCTGGGNGQATPVPEEEIASGELAAKLNEACGSPLWERAVDEAGQPRVALAMQNHTLGFTTDRPSGMCDMPISVQLESLREDVELVYSVSGGSKQTYTAPIQLDEDAIVVVYAQLRGYPDIYRAYALMYQDALYPVKVDQPAGLYRTPIQVELSCAEPGAQIYYTIDGSDPREEDGITYTPGQKIDLMQSTVITAVAQVDGAYGDPLAFEYVISPEITPTYPPGNYDEPIEVGLECAISGYQIYYTTDGSDPAGESGILYDKSAPIEIYTTTDLKVAATMNGGWGETQTFTYTYPEVVITPRPDPGDYPDVLTVTLDRNTPYLELSYRRDSGAEEPYRGGIDVYETTTITVYARYKSKLVASETFTYTLPQTKISSSPAAGNYAKIQTIELSVNGAYTELYYTLDGSDPATEGTLYTEPFELDRSATVRVCAKIWGNVVATGSFYYNLSSLPYVIASPASGDKKAPLEVTLTSSPSGQDIYYTLDGSDPKTNGIKYEAPIRIEKPRTTVIRAVPKSYFGDYGRTSEFRYTFNTQTFRVDEAVVTKRADYEIDLKVSNTLPEDKTVTFYAAAYLNGQLLNAAGEQAELPEGTRGKEIMIRYPYSSAEQLPQDAVIKVFCLDSVTRQPYCDSLTYEVSEADVFQELDSISVSPNPIVGQVGERIERPKVTAHYTNGRPDQVVSMNLTFTPDYEVVLVGYPSLDLSIKSEGEGVLTVFYSEGGITKSTKVPVIGKAANVNLGFLADPTADSLPEDAIPISTAEDLAAIKGADSVGKTYYLTRDIQLTGEWEPIYGFQGTLDGRGYTVSGLYISSASKEQLAALFASAYDAVIKNLAVEIDPRGVAAYNDDAEGDYAYAAGLVGDSRDTDYINCYVTGGPVSATGAAPYAGGLVGYLMNQKENRVVNCFSTCNVSVVSTQATIGNVCMAGGLIGELESGNGYQTTTISRCYATGNVSLNYPGGSTGQAGTQVGGLLGGGSRLEISDCFALGEVNARRGVTTTTSFTFAGGLGGWLSESSLERCYAAGDVAGGSKSTVGGLTAASASIDDCYRVNQSIQGTKYYNDGETIADSWEQSAYVGFDFTSTWTFTEGAFRGLPHLQYQE